MTHTHKTQTGSAHVVLVVVLVLALITALGWIFWQNFIHKEPVVKETDVLVVKPHDKDAAKTTPSEKSAVVKTLKFEGWGVEVPLTDNSYDFVLAVDPDSEGQRYYVQSYRVAEKCSNDGAVGLIVKGEEGTSATATVDGVKYGFSMPQSACAADPSSSDGAAVNKYMEAASNSFAKQFPSLRSSK